jgi:hypothetical protein
MPHAVKEDAGVSLVLRELGVSICSLKYMSLSLCVDMTMLL